MFVNTAGWGPFVLGSHGASSGFGQAWGPATVTLPSQMDGVSLFSDGWGQRQWEGLFTGLDSSPVRTINWQAMVAAELPEL